MGGVEKIQEQKPQILVAKTPVYIVYLADPGIWGDMSAGEPTALKKEK